VTRGFAGSSAPCRARSLDQLQQRCERGATRYPVQTGSFRAISSATGARASTTRPRARAEQPLFKVVSWYDNEQGYATRCADMMDLLAKKDGK